MRGAYKKASDEQILKLYEELESVWKVAKALGMCGQSIHERLVKMGKNKHINIFTKTDDKFLVQHYQKYASIGKLQELADKMERTKPFICRQARRLGMTSYTRKKPYIGPTISRRMKKWMAENPHPRGMLGKKHTKKTLDIIGMASVQQWQRMTEKSKARRVLKMMKTRVANGTNLAFNRISASWKCGWRTIGGKEKYFRSAWEANYARYLDWLKSKKQILDWEHEPETFWFEGVRRGCVSYLPDFRITELNKSISYHEVKGWMDSRSKTKIRRMKKYYPHIKLLIIESKQYYSIAKSVSMLIPDWEKVHRRN